MTEPPGIDWFRKLVISLPMTRPVPPCVVESGLLVKPAGFSSSEPATVGLELALLVPGFAGMLARYSIEVVAFAGNCSLVMRSTSGWVPTSWPVTVSIFRPLR